MSNVHVSFSIATVKVAILTIVLRDQLSPGLAALAITYIMMIGDSTRSSRALLSLSLTLSLPRLIAIINEVLNITVIITLSLQNHEQSQYCFQYMF